MSLSPYLTGAKSGTYYPPGTAPSPNVQNWSGPTPQDAASTPNYDGFYVDKANMSKDTEFMGYRLLNDILGLWRGQVGQAYGMQGQNAAARRRAVDALNPANTSVISAEYRGNATKSARERGRMLGAMMRGQGYGQGAEDAANLGAMNDAARSSSEFDQQLFSPSAQLQRAMQAIGITDPTQIMSLMQVFPDLDRMILGERGVNDAAHARSAGSGLGGIIGRALGALTGGGGGNILGMLLGGGGGGGSLDDPELGTWNGWGYS